GSRQQVCLHDVSNVCKIACLFTVTEDVGSTLFNERSQEARYDACILRSRVLSWPKDIEVAQCNGFKSIDVCEYATEKFTRELLDGVWRHWMSRHIFSLGQGWSIAIDRRGASIDYPPYTSIPRCK